MLPIVRHKTQTLRGKNLSGSRSWPGLSTGHLIPHGLLRHHGPGDTVNKFRKLQAAGAFELIFMPRSDAVEAEADDAHEGT